MLLASKRVGRHAHPQIIEHGCDLDVSVGNCLVDMHTRCGSMDDACGVFFHIIPSCDVVKCIGTGTIFRNATGRGAPCHFCGVAECMCNCSCT